MLNFSRIILTTLLLSWMLAVASVANEDEWLENFRQLESQRWRKYYEQAKQTEAITSFDVAFYHLNVDISIHTPFIKGDVLCRFNSVEDNLHDIKLNLLNTFKIDSIHGNVSSYTFENDTIYITLDKGYESGTAGEVRIYYHGEPQPYEEVVGFQYNMSDGVPKIYTASEPIFSHYWWPCKEGTGDKADSAYIDITIPDTTIKSKKLVAISNGSLENTISKAGKTTFQWRERYPIATYHIMLAVSNYHHFNHNYVGQSGENFRINYWVYPENYSYSKPFVAQIPEVMTFLSELFGKYPFDKEKYAITQMPNSPLQNQETPTNSILMAAFWQPQYFWVAVRGLAHSWFGCMISVTDVKHAWLNEGFGKYCEALWAEHVDGFSGYKNRMTNYRYLGPGSLVFKEVPESILDIYRSRLIYDKGASVLHMLRGVLGDSVFFDCLYEYTNHPDLMYKHATTEDFQNICEKVSGQDLNYFFEQWAYDERYPFYHYSFFQDDSTYFTTLKIEQIQEQLGYRPLFEMPLQLQIIYKDVSDTVVTVWNNQKEQIYHFSLNKKIDRVKIDPDGWVLHKAKLKKWVVDVTDDLINNIPLEFVLQQNYPNPFNPVTTIQYSLPQPGRILLKIYNLQGQLVKTLLDAEQPAGIYTRNWEAMDDSGANLSSGVYFYYLQVTDPATGVLLQNQKRKMILLR